MMHQHVLNPGARNYIYHNPSVFYAGQANTGAPQLHSGKKIPKKKFAEKFLRKLEKAKAISESGQRTTGEYKAEEPPFDVDVVFTWVKQDAAFRVRKNQWLEKYRVKPSDNEDNRYNSSEELKFAIRSVRTYAPWVRKIYVVVSDDQRPSFVEESEDLQIVPHSIIYSQKHRHHLPTFNSQSIETHLHKIPYLAEHFLYFNDDQFFGRHTQWHDFFTSEGHTKIVMGGLAASGKKYPNMSKNAMGWVNNNHLLNKVFPQHSRDIRRCNIHQGVPLLKTKFEECWNHPTVKTQLEKTSQSKFRMDTDMYFIGFLVHFTLYNHQSIITELPTFYVQLYDPSQYGKIFESLLIDNPKLFCINDGITDTKKRKRHKMLLNLFLNFVFSP